MIFWLYFSNVENTFRILLKHSKFCSFIKTTSLKQKQHVLWTFQFCQSRRIRTLPVWAFCWLIFWLSFSIGENTPRILLKYSKFSSFIKTISLKEKQHVLRTFQFWPKSLYPDLTGVAIFSIDFLKCWKYHSNSSETFKMLFFHQKHQFEAKTACFADFSILTKIAVSGPYRRGHFVSWFFWLYFSNVENTFRILLKHSKFCSFIKTTSLKQKQHVLWTFQFCQSRCIRTLPVWAFCWLIFWLSFSIGENTLRILLKYSKFCSFIKTISLKQKQHVFWTFQFWPKSLFSDLAGVAILLVDFLVEFFKCWK